MQRYEFNKRVFVLITLTFLASTSALAQTDSVTAKKITPIVTDLLFAEPSSPAPISSGSFIEQNGLIVIELESLDAPDGWQRKSGDGALGDYLEWEGQNSFNQPGNGLISINIAISNPGTYQFIWRSSIREGTSTTDANDSWLRIHSDNYYGVKNSETTPVCPYEQLSTNRCNGRSPNGSSRDGWFKIYRSGGVAGDWQWRALTSDSDGHIILADFDQVGEYLIEISGRSKGHAIDRLVLFRSRNVDNNVTEDFATDAARPETAVAP